MDVIIPSLKDELSSLVETSREERKRLKDILTIILEKPQDYIWIGLETSIPTNYIDERKKRYYTISLLPERAQISHSFDNTKPVIIIGDLAETAYKTVMQSFSRS